MLRQRVTARAVRRVAPLGSGAQLTHWHAEPKPPVRRICGAWPFHRSAGRRLATWRSIRVQPTFRRVAPQLVAWGGGEAARPAPQHAVLQPATWCSGCTQPASCCQLATMRLILLPGGSREHVGQHAVQKPAAGHVHSPRGAAQHSDRRFIHGAYSGRHGPNSGSRTGLGAGCCCCAHEGICSGCAVDRPRTALLRRRPALAAGHALAASRCGSPVQPAGSPCRDARYVRGSCVRNGRT